MKTLLLFGAIALSINVFGQVPNYVPSNGLVGWWPFNGNANDESGNGNNGVLNSGNNGSAVYDVDRNGIQSSALSLSSNPTWNSLGPYIEILGSNTLTLTTYAINIWIRPNTTCLTGELVNKGPDNVGFLSRIQNPLAGVAFGSLPQYVDYPFSVSTMQWTMLTFNRNSSGISELFINGTLVYTSSSSTPTNNNFNFAFGAMPSGGTNGSYYPYQGLFDDIGIWNRALTQQEITSLYNGCQLSVSTQPNSQQININNNAQFIVGSSDPSATFQWQTDLGVGFQNLNSVGQYSSTNTNTLSVLNVTMSNNNQPFRCIISSSLCSDTSNVAVLTVNNNVGITEFSQDNLFSVFPNPAESLINVKADTKLVGNVYSIYDNAGRVVLTGILKSENTAIELGNLSRGIYLFSVGVNMKQTFKVIKE